MFRNEREFRELVSGLKIDAEPNRAHREQLHRRMLQTFEEGRSGSQPEMARSAKRARWVLNLSMGKLAVAAVVVLSLCAVFYQLGRPADVLAAEVGRTLQAMEKMGWMHVVTTKGTEVEHRWHDLASDKLYLTTAQGGVWCWDNGPAQRQLVYSPRSRTLMIDNLPPKEFYGSGSVFTMLDTIVEQRRQGDASITRHNDVFRGRKVRTYKVETAQTDSGVSFQRNGTERIVARTIETFTVDPKTRLLVAGHVEYTDRQGQVIVEETLDIEYPQIGPASVHDLGVPADVRIIDRTQQPIGTPGDAPMPTPAPTPAPQGRLIEGMNV